MRREPRSDKATMFLFDASTMQSWVVPGHRRLFPIPRVVIILTALAFVAGAALPSGAATVESLGDASITRDDAAHSWILSAGGARLLVNLERGSDFRLLALQSPTG